MNRLLPATAIVAAAAMLCISCSGRQDSTVAIPVVVERAAWGWQQQDSLQSTTHVPSRLTIHHSGEIYTGTPPPPEKLRGLQSWSRRERGWSDIPYHYVLDLSGAVYEARDIRYKGDTSTDYDTDGHVLVSVMGNYEEQTFTSAQFGSLIRLSAWLCKTHGLPADSIRMHRDFVPSTLCPGKNLIATIDDNALIDSVKAHLASD